LPQAWQQQQSRQMKVMPALLIVGILAVSGSAEDVKPEPYSPELLKKAED